jgi:site-specific DNA-methyltransferase (adenine-specific)
VSAPKPYFDDGTVSLYVGDCREVTEWLAGDVVVTDPPYGRGWRSGSGMTNSHGRGRGSIAHGGISGDAGIKGAHAGFRRDFEEIFLVGPWPVGVGGHSSVLRTGGLVAGPRGIGTRNGHPHAKPVDVLEILIAACPPGVIADPFAGSGSTLVAARNLGRKAIGVELKEEYAEKAARRLSQGTLFGDVLEVAG